MPIEHIYENDSLNTGRKKINDAIDASDRADRNASEAVTVANEKGDKAVETAERAEQKSDSTQQQLDNIVIESGTSDAEVIQARTDIKGNTFKLLKNRIDSDVSLLNDAVLKKADTATLNYVTPEMFGYTEDIEDFRNNEKPIDDWIDFAKKNHIKAVSSGIYLTKDIDFRGVDLSINGLLYLHNCSIILGNDSRHGKGYPQFVEIIKQNIDAPVVYIKGAKGQEITIGECLGGVKFLLSEKENENSIAYSTFNFSYVDSIYVENDYGHKGNLWFNENSLYLNRCNYLQFSGTYDHNNNRIYGGTFEGQGRKIQINRGRNNYFYDTRLERASEIFFASGTYNNLVFNTYQNSQYPEVVSTEIIDEGYGNRIINPYFTYSDKIINDRVTTFNYSLFPNYSLTSIDNKLYVDSWSDMYDSGLLIFNGNYNFQFKLIDSDNGIRAAYKLYDSNMVEIKDPVYIANMSGVGHIKSGEFNPAVNNLKNIFINFNGSSIEGVKYVRFLIKSGGSAIKFLETKCVLRDLGNFG